MGTFGILIALALLIALAYRGISVIVLAPLAALLAALLQFDAPLLASYTQVFMGATGRFIAQYFPLFLLGALFGRFMEDSGAAQAIARRFTQWLGPPNAILGQTYLAMGEAAGIGPALLHRVTTIATGGLDALPHNGAMITLLAICRLGHREAYGDIFVVAVLGPIVALMAVVALGSWLGAF